MNSSPESSDGSDGDLEHRVRCVRAFNRRWTAQIGALDASLLQTPYSLTEARVLYELAQHDAMEVAELRRALGLDAGDLSRIMSGFKAGKLVTTEAAAGDTRRQVARLTARGRRAFAVLDQRSAEEVRMMLGALPEQDQRRLVAAMATIQGVLRAAPRPAAYVIRPLQPGDLGWVVARHGAVYAEEYGWDESFEALVARIVADYVEHRDPKRDNAWIAEVAGEPVGCVFCIKHDDSVAQLRILLVEPKARGLGIGARLVEECLRFARRAGYARMTLWTNSVLESARRIYEHAGFTLADEQPHHSFGHDLVGQRWSLVLSPGSPR